MEKINKKKDKIIKIINENREKYISYKYQYKFNQFSEEFLEFIDGKIKDQVDDKYIRFGFFDIKENFKGYGKINVLTYFSRHDEFEIIDNDIIIYVIKRRINGQINHEEEIIKYLNYYLGKISNSIIFEFFSKIDINKYKSNRKLFRIILYIKKILNQCGNITYKRQNRQEKIILGNDQGILKKQDKLLGISDYWFGENEIWNPIIEFNQDQLDEVEFGNKVNKKYFKEKFGIKLKKNTGDNIETLNYYGKIATRKEAISSAFLEGYNKNTKNGKKAIENIFNACDEFDGSEDFNIEFLIKVQKIIVEGIKDKLNGKNVDVDGLRTGYVGIIQRKKLIYGAPKPEHIYVMLNNLCGLFNKYIKEGIHPVIISIVIPFLFVKIHPFGDGNGRTARFLQIWILKKLNYINGYYNIDLSQMIIHEKNGYYNMFEQSNLPIKEKIKYKEIQIDDYCYYFEINYNKFSDYYGMNFKPMFEYFLNIYNKALYLSILNHQYQLKKKRLNELIKIKFGDKLETKQKNFIKNILKKQVKYDNNYEIGNNLRNKLYKQDEERQFEYDEIDKIQEIFKQLENEFAIIKIGGTEKIGSDEIFNKTNQKNKKLDLD